VERWGQAYNDKYFAGCMKPALVRGEVPFFWDLFSTVEGGKYELVRRMTEVGD